MSASPTFWLTVAAVFALNGMLSWAWGEPVLAVAQAATGGLALVAAGAAWRRMVAHGQPDAAPTGPGDR
ncbi:hypothetical protein [Cellulomonas chitinilytica]|uniref:hypothetical protein n=1 Tax=Cellulomonas chitinilytica TaxID=398759 RepID=UPI001941F690|nr:hypothetical protein [Cellulomonas chitinilytica]